MESCHVQCLELPNTATIHVSPPPGHVYIRRAVDHSRDITIYLDTVTLTADMHASNHALVNVFGQTTRIPYSLIFHARIPIPSHSICMVMATQDLY